ncbi:MAG: LamG-like jellyroll fold domain-containing protein [bacterium]
MDKRTKTIKYATGLFAVVAWLCAGDAQAANAYLDVNGTENGLGLVNGGTYSWDLVTTNWTTNIAGTTVPTVFSNDGTMSAYFGLPPVSNFTVNVANTTLTNSGAMYIKLGCTISLIGAGTASKIVAPSANSLTLNLQQDSTLLLGGILRFNPSGNLILGTPLTVDNGSKIYVNGGAITFDSDSGAVQIRNRFVIDAGTVSVTRAAWMIKGYETWVNGGSLSFSNDLCMGYQSSNSLPSASLLNVNGCSVNIAGSAYVGYADYTYPSEINVSSGQLAVAGSVLLGNDANVSGTLNVSGGSVRVDDTAYGISVGRVNTASSVTTNTTYMLSISGTGSVKSGALCFGTATAVTFGDNTTGRLNMTGGTLGIGTGGINLKANRPATLDLTMSSGTLMAWDNFSVDSGLAFNIGTAGQGLTIQAADDSSIAKNITFNGTLTGAGSLTKTGAGTLTLAGANTYSGVTTISNGILRLGVANAITNNGPVHVAGGVYDLNWFTVTNGAVLLSSGAIAHGTLQASSLEVSSNNILAVSLKNSPLLHVSGGTLTLAEPTTDALIRYDFDSASISGTNVVNLGTGGAIYDGLIMGAGFATNMSGRFGQAIQRTNANVAAGVITRNSVPLPNAFTFAAWVKSSGTFAGSSAPRIINNSYANGGYLGASSGQANFQTYIKNNNMVSSQAATDTTGWHHLAMTWNGSSVMMYYDGVVITSKTYAVNAAYTNKLGFGCDPNDFLATKCWYGSLDEANVFTRALSSNEVVSLMGKTYGTALIPVTASLQIDSGATLDLGGTAQQVAGLSGGGAVTNGPLTVTGSISLTNGVAENLLIYSNLTVSAGTALNYDYTATTSDVVNVTGTLTLQGTANAVSLSAIGSANPPPSRITLFTFGTLIGDPTAWTVQGALQPGYAYRVRKDANSVYISIARMGTMIRVL